MSDDHEWCRDVQRDEQVRAAEDAAAVPSIQHRDLPEQVSLLWASLGDIIGRVVRLEGEMDAGQDEEAAPAVCDSASPAEGLRTERVTLEVTQRVEDYVAPSRWNWCGQLGSHAQPGESVRVVEETTIGSGDVFRDVGCGSTADEIVRLTDERNAARAEAERLRIRVAELEAASAARPIGWIARHEQQPPVGKYVMCRWDVSARPGYAREVGYGVAKRGPDGMWRAPNGVEKIAPVHWMPLLPGVEGGDDWELPHAAAPAANAGGEQQPPRGWMTAEEREAVDAAADAIGDRIDAYKEQDGDRRRIEVLDGLLARETPPRVKVPDAKNHNTVTGQTDAVCVSCWNECRMACIAAIRAAGGEVEG